MALRQELTGNPRVDGVFSDVYRILNGFEAELDKQVRLNRSLIDTIKSFYEKDRYQPLLRPLGFTAIAGENLAQGEVVCSLQVASGGISGKVFRCPTTGNENELPHGVVFKDALANEEVIIITNGKVLVKPEAGITASLGFLLYTSGTTAGRVTQAASTGAAQHWRECGHWLETGSAAGALTYASVHFN